MKSRLLPILLLLGMTAPVAAQQTTGDWQVSCEDGACRMAQSLVAQGSGTAILLMRVFGPNAPTALLTVPLGVFLKPGIVVQIDQGRPRAYGFEICDPLGCHAGVNLDEDLLRELKRGRVAQIVFSDGSQKQVSLSISLTGFTAAFDALAEAKP